jgi:hypothetical protein
MPENVHVSCKRKPDANNPHKRILGLGGIHAGNRWYMTEDDIIAELEKPESTRRWDFFTNDGKQSAWVIVATRSNRKYLKTQPDTDKEDNLLSLPECPQ